jgi:nucleoside transporter
LTLPTFAGAYTYAMSRLRYLQFSTLFFLQFFIWGSWYVTTGAYLLRTLQFNGREVGLIYGATAIAATVTPFLLGILADRLFAVEKLLSVLHLAGGALMLGISHLREFVWIYPALIGYALLYMPTFALASALAFHHVADGARDFPLVRLWGTAGWIVAGLLISYHGWEPTAMPMRISAAASLAQGLYCLSLPHTPPQRGAGRSLKELLGPEIVHLLRSRNFLVLILALLLISIPSGFYYSFTNAFLGEIDVRAPAAKMSIGQVSEVLLMLFMPWFFVRLGFKRVIAIGLFAWGFRYLLFALGGEGEWIPMIYLALFLHGIAFNFTALTGQIYIDRLAPPHLRSTAQGLMSLATLGFGALIGAFIAGEVVGRFALGEGMHQWRYIWLVPGAVGLFTTVLFVVLFKDDLKAR